VVESERVIVYPHRGYKAYRLPMFVIHASDRAITLRHALGDFTIRDLAGLRTSERVLYSCVSPDDLCLYGDPRAWRIRTWNGRISSMEYGDVKVYPLTDAWDDTIPAFFDYLDSRGVAASSLNTMSLNLWRTTLTGSVAFHEESPYDEMLGPVAIRTGGRKEARRGVYRNRSEYDITAAYPHALASPLPTRLAPAPAGFVRRMDWDRWEGLATARIRIPPMHWGPVPVVVDLQTELTCYGFTQANEWATVCLPLSELRMAAEFGCDVDLIRFHAGMDTDRPFADWLAEVVPALRSLPGMSGVIGKLVANRLWSCFAVSPMGVRREHTFDVNGRMETTELPPDSEGQILRRAATTYVGAIVQSRVRERVYREGICQLPDVVYIDTDGVISRRTDSVPVGWREKTRLRYVDVAGPQALNYYCDHCLPPPAGHDGPHWTVAGAATTEAKSRLFRVMREGGMVITNINNVLPAQDVNRATTPDRTETAPSQAALLFDTPARTRQDTA
jgi:hypothetical protein